MGTDEVGTFGWIQSSAVRDGACVTLVAPADADGVVRSFGGDLAGARHASLADIGMPPVTEPVVAIKDLGAWLLAVEVNGWQGSRPEVLRRVSASGRAVSAYWNVNLATRFSYAVGGQVLTAFDVMSSPTDRYLWTAAHWLAPVGVVRFVSGAGMDEIAVAFGADTGTARGGIPSLSRDAVIAFRDVGDWLVAVEGPAPTGAIRRVKPMPTGTTTVSLTWAARRRSWVHYMTADTLVAGLDPQRPDQRVDSDPEDVAHPPRTI